MSQFELTATNELWGDSSRWPKDFLPMCEALSQAAEQGLTQALYTADTKLRKDMILVPDSQDAAFTETFEGITGVVCVRRLSSLGDCHHQNMALLVARLGGHR